MYCCELRRGTSICVCGAGDHLPLDALPRNPLVDALDAGWLHGRLGRPLGVHA